MSSQQAATSPSWSCAGTAPEGTHVVGTYPYERITNPHTQQAFGLSRGHDGQFYYALARAPLAYHKVGLDRAPVRHVRLLYPLLCWMLTLGDPYLLFWAMPLVNLVAIGGLAAFGAAMALEQKLSPWWGVLLPFALNAGMPALHDLTDIVSTLAICGLLCSLIWKWPVWIVACWSAAALFCRLENFAVVAALLGVALWRRQWSLVLAQLPGLCLWLGWAIYIGYLYNESPIQPTQLAGPEFPPGFGNFSPPLIGRIPTPFWGFYFHWQRGLESMDLLCMGLLAWQLILVGALILWRSDPVLIVTAITGAALVAVSGQAVYGSYWDYARVFSWLPLAVWLGAVRAKQRWILLTLALPGWISINEVRSWT